MSDLQTLRAIRDDTLRHLSVIVYNQISFMENTNQKIMVSMAGQFIAKWYFTCLHIEKLESLKHAIIPIDKSVTAQIPQKCKKIAAILVANVIHQRAKDVNLTLGEAIVYVLTNMLPLASYCKNEKITIYKWTT